MTILKKMWLIPDKSHVNCNVPAAEALTEFLNDNFKSELLWGSEVETEMWEQVLLTTMDDPVFSLRSSSRDSRGDPSVCVCSVRQPIGSLGPVLPGPCWYPIHNGTVGSPLPAAIQASYQTNQSFFSRNTSWAWQTGVSQHLVLWERKRREKKGR